MREHGCFASDARKLDSQTQRCDAGNSDNDVEPQALTANNVVEMRGEDVQLKLLYFCSAVQRGQMTELRNFVRKRRFVAPALTWNTMRSATC